MTKLRIWRDMIVLCLKKACWMLVCTIKLIFRWRLEHPQTFLNNLDVKYRLSRISFATPTIIRRSRIN